jgi:hypothetical protein
MIIMNVSILLILFIFAIVTHAWSDPGKSMSYAANQVTTMKIDENKGLVQKKKKPALKRAKSIKKENGKSQSALCLAGDGATLGGTKRDVDFLRAVEEKRKARWIDLDQILKSAEFLQNTRNNHFLSSREAPAAKSSNSDFSQSISKAFPDGSNYFEGGTKSETLRHLESKKEEILREIFMGLRFSFTPTGRHVVLEMNVSPSSEKGPGLVIPF